MALTYRSVQEREAIRSTPPTKQAPLCPAPAKTVGLQQTIEDYFSDEHLSHDEHLRELIVSSPGGWVDLDTVLELKRLRPMRADRVEALRALKSSWLETWRESDGSYAAVRRPTSQPLPTFDRTASKQAAKVKNDRNKRPQVFDEEDAAVDKDLMDVEGNLDSSNRFDGIVAEFDDDSGAATISSSDAEAKFHRQVIADWRELEQAGVAINVGSLVSFTVDMVSGEPHARNLQLRTPPDDEEDNEGGPRVDKRRRRTREASVGERFEGVVKSFNDAVGLGFIACRDTHSTFGRDVAVDSSEFACFSVGDLVSFELAIDDMGTPKAVQVESTGEAEDLGEVEVEVEDPAEVKASKKPGTPISKAGAGAGGGTRHRGDISSFNQSVGMGRISCTSARLGTLVAVSAKEFDGFSVGDNISFSITKDPTFGMLLAVDLEADDT